MNGVAIVTLADKDLSGLYMTVRRSFECADIFTSSWYFVAWNKDQEAKIKEWWHSQSDYHSRIRLYTTCSNGGIAKSLNAGIRIVKEDWVLVLHAGDYLVGSCSEGIRLIPKILSGSTTEILHSFRTCYALKSGEISGTSKQVRRKQAWMAAFIPHESTFVSIDLYRKRMYREDFKSALDYEFFLWAILHDNARVTYHKDKLTVFELGGTSSDLTVSSKEVARAVVSLSRHNHKLLLGLAYFSVFIVIYLRKLAFMALNKGILGMLRQK